MESLLDRVEHFSNWQCMPRAITLCLRYLKLLQQKRDKGVNKDSINLRKRSIRQCVPVTASNNKSIPEERIAVEQIQEAETTIIKTLQNDLFEDEIKKLKSIEALANQQDRKSKAVKKSYLKRNSCLYHLDPFLGSDAIQRVGGRQHSSVGCNVKFQIIPLKASHITTLIIRYYHEQVGHQG